MEKQDILNVLKQYHIHVDFDTSTQETDKQLIYLMMGTINPDFYKAFLAAPAGKMKHGGFPGGLEKHCNYMYTYLLHWKTKHPDSELTEFDCAVIAYLHDLCKVRLYERCPDGTYTYAKGQSFDRHAVESVRIIEEELKLPLSPLQRSCILLHMSSWSTSEDILAISSRDKEWLNNLNHIPILQAVNWADMKAYMIEAFEERIAAATEILNKEIT